MIAYIPDLPANIQDNQTLENLIRQCLERKHRQEIAEIYCYRQIGIGIILLRETEDKEHLLNVIEEITIDRSNNTKVSFVNELELICYVVIDTILTKDLPLPNELCQRWIDLYKPSIQPQCEQLSVQFPNIFRIITHSFDDFIKSTSIKEFSIEKQLAVVYFHADYCFFEDLPRTITIDRLKTAIEKQISSKLMSKEWIHIQYDRDAGNAVVLTSGPARIWSSYPSIQIDGRDIDKKYALAFRILIEKVPKGLPTSAIKDHSIFAGKVSKIIPSTEYVIFELSDRNIYEKCVHQGCLRIGEDVLGIQKYTASCNPEDKDIDDETWYETDMLGLKSDITQFVSLLQHAIFRYKWNSRAFLRQFHRLSSIDPKLRGKELEKFEKESNTQRHRLRMTVILNTIGIVKKGFYRLGEKEIKLKSDRLKTILYNHKSVLQRGKTISLSEATQFPYSSTTVKVVNGDCLIVYKDLVSKGLRPVLLNMANATNPGGGYKRGDGAQEETLFRRSNYYRSLDLSLDNDNPTLRSICKSNCDIESLEENDQLYPMDEFGGIYTSGLTVFRLPEETGYEFMEIPMYDVCAIAMAAYRDPKLENKHLLNAKYSLGTRKKIENIFAIAHHHRHDSLVLSALGCGAFRNPPTHIAKIFKSVIEQYAGYFKTIYFSIIDDHNAGQELNPHGNLRPFQKILDNLTIEPKRYKTVDMMIGPRRILKQTTNEEVMLSDIRICYLTPCHHGGKCEDLKDEQHLKEYSHPPLCPYAECKDKHDDQHMLWFRHRQKCFYGGECNLIDSDPIHSAEFEHPIYCRDGGKCENMADEHLKSYRHVPLCRHRRLCTEFNRGSTEHCQNFRHCIPTCRFGAYCIKFHDEKHYKEEKHPFQPPCPFTPFHCRYFTQLSESRNTKSLPIDVQNHCSQFSHVCRFGRDCHEKAEIHLKTTIHIARHVCSFGDQCRKINEDEHLNSFTHPNIPDIRRLCPYSGYRCRDKQKPEHITQFRHDGNHDRSGVISCFGQNRQINFVENQANIIKIITGYAQTLAPKKAFTVPTEIQKLVRALQPVHRCGKVIFESILVHGHVMSREHMEHLKKASFVAQAVQEHKHVRAIFDKKQMTTLEEHARDYIQAIVSREYSNKYSALVTSGDGTAALKADASTDYDTAIRIQERILKGILKPEEIDRIRNLTIDVTEASWNLNHSPTGLGHAPDKKLGTDKHVFSILGPNLGHYYGDIIIVFKSELMLHPDTNFSPQAATSFFSGQTFNHRPWVQDPGNDPDQRVECFHQSKLHCSVPGYEYAAAAELIAITGTHKKTFDIHSKDIFTRWKKVDSHQVFEAHLPQLVPLDYIDEIYIPKSLFALLTPAAQESATKIFGNSLHITKHEIDPTPAFNGGPRPNDAGRANYQDHVVEKLIEKFEKRMEHTSHLHGIVLTLIPTKFTDHIVLPLTISDAFHQHRQTHKHSSNSDTIYIYWQAMYDDMMITLSNEQISSDASQPNIRCLVCYIAEQPSTTTTNYHETYSYLNAGDPYQHDVIMANGRSSASSNSFHRGCNVGDFLTYCLKIEKKTGEVTLSHAGSNGIYCYESISCQFSKTTLDLHKLNYIHVSAGSQKVPIRNLFVSFEQILDLHPSFDKDFKGNNHSTAQNKKSQTRERNSSPHEEKDSSDEKSPSKISRVADAIARVFGYGGDDDGDEKKLQPCPDSINCLKRESSKHMKEYLHPCPYSELCPNKNKEPHLTHEPHKVEQCPERNSCRKLEDPHHRAKYRHRYYPDFLIPCHDGSKCSDKSKEHRITYSHGEQIQISAARSSSLKPSSEYHEKVSYNPGRNDQQIACRHGSNCRDQNDAQHCSKYSHPNQRGSKSSNIIPCRHGSDCRDQNDPQHCSKYSHPDNQRKRDDKVLCKFGRQCHDHDPHHRAKYSHPHK